MIDILLEVHSWYEESRCRSPDKLYVCTSGNVNHLNHPLRKDQESKCSVTHLCFFYEATLFNISLVTASIFNDPGLFCFDKCVVLETDGVVFYLPPGLRDRCVKTVRLDSPSIALWPSLAQWMPPSSLLTFKSVAGILRSSLPRRIPSARPELSFKTERETKMGFMISLPQRILSTF